MGWPLGTYSLVRTLDLDFFRCALGVGISGRYFLGAWNHSTLHFDWKTMKIRPPPAWLFWGLVCWLLITFAIWGAPAHGQESPDEWWALTLDLQAQMHRIHNVPDQRFIREMVNKLAVEPGSVPTLGEQFWLLSIRDELKRRRK